MYKIGGFIFTQDSNNDLHYTISYNPEYAVKEDPNLAYIDIDSGIISMHDMNNNCLYTGAIKVTKFPFDVQTLFHILNELYKIVRLDSCQPNGKPLNLFIKSIRINDFIFHILYEKPLRAMAIHYPAVNASYYGIIEEIDGTLRVLDGDGNLLFSKEIADINILEDKNIVVEIENALICRYNICNRVETVDIIEG